MIITDVKISAFQRLLPTLNFETNLQNEREKPVKLFEMLVELRIFHDYVATYKIDIQPFELPAKQRDNTRHFEFNLNPYLIQRIQEKRNDKEDIPFSLTFFFKYFDASKTTTTIHDMIVERKDFTNEISSNKWVSYLKTWGFGDHLLVEVPLPPIPNVVEFEKVKTHIEKARDCYFKGNDEGTITACRKIWESLRKNGIIVDQAKKNMLSSLAHLVDGHTSKSDTDLKSYKINQLHFELYNLCHVAPHDGYVVTREDADLVYSTTMQLLRYYGRILEKEKG